MANAGRFDGLHGVDRALAVVGSVLAWPVLWLPNVCASNELANDVAGLPNHRAAGAPRVGATTT